MPNYKLRYFAIKSVGFIGATQFISAKVEIKLDFTLCI